MHLEDGKQREVLATILPNRSLPRSLLELAATSAEKVRPLHQAFELQV